VTSKTAKIDIVSRSGVHTFVVELATSDAEHQRGLMLRDGLPAGHGMLFVFGHARPLSFWMRGVRIPLDIIFIRANGRILRIAENAKPLSETSIPSGGPAIAVLEVAGGTAHKLGITTGDTVRQSSWRGSDHIADRASGLSRRMLGRPVGREGGGSVDRAVAIARSASRR
jgi:uncharacterized protein